MQTEQNVILLTIDCLRADHVTSLGYARQTTPNIDYLAKKGALFSQAISNGVGTPESFPSIMTSTYALMNPNSGGVCATYWVKLSSRWPTIAQVLKSREFSTAAFNANPYITSIFHYDRGFDVFDDSLELYRRDSSVDKLHRKLGTLLGNKFLRADVVNQKAVSWLKKNPDRFFLWLHYMDVHSPYNPKKNTILERIDAIRLERKKRRNPKRLSEDERKRLIGFYDQELKYVDSEIGSLVDKLTKIDISLNNTFFIVTADHGEQFMEHGEWGHGRLYDEVIRVPLIICGPGIKENNLIGDQISLLDLGPTVIDVLNIPKVESFLGRTLVPIMEGRAKESNNENVISETLTQIFSCRTEDWKYITDRKNRHELYNLRIDPNEKTNLASKYMRKVRELHTVISEHILMEEKVKQSVLEERRTLSAEEKAVLEERLKGLGYL